MDCGFRVSMAENGFVLEYEDPEVREKNRGDGPWIDPWQKRVYTSVEALTADISALVPIMAEYVKNKDEDHSTDDQYKTALSQAFKE